MTIQCKVITRHTNTRNNNTTYLETHCDRGVLPRRPVDPAATRSGSSRTGARRGGAAGAAGPKRPGGRATEAAGAGAARPKRPDRSGQAGGRSTAGEEARVQAQGAGEVRAQGAGEAAGARPTAGLRRRRCAACGRGARWMRALDSFFLQNRRSAWIWAELLG